MARTFIDKVFAICDYRIKDMEKRDSRHLYDVCKMFPLITFDDDFKKLIVEVRNDKIKFKHNHNHTAELRFDINEMLQEIIDSRFYENDYITITEKLIYEDAKYDDVIKNGIAKLISLKLF